MMNDRLKLIYSKIKSDIGIADIGTDHGYIPIALAAEGYSGNIIASDIHELPLNIARSNALEAGISDRISFILADGIRPDCLERVDTVIVAGMGGDTICHILDQAYEHINRTHTFLLQPMSKPEILRYWLINNGFSITDESLVYDNNRLYSVLTVHFTGNNSILTDMELYTGCNALIKNSVYYIDQLLMYRRKFERICTCSNGNSTLNVSILAELKNTIDEEL